MSTAYSPSSTRRKRYSTNRSQIRKSIGYRLQSPPIGQNNIEEKRDYDHSNNNTIIEKNYGNYKSFKKSTIKPNDSFPSIEESPESILDNNSDDKFALIRTGTVNQFNTSRRASSAHNLENGNNQINNKITSKITNDNQVLEKAKNFQDSVLQMRKSFMSDFADPNYNCPDPIKTYNIKALNTQYNLQIKKLESLNKDDLGIKQSPTMMAESFLMSKATILRAERAKAYIGAYYLLQQRYQTKFHPIVKVDDDKEDIVDANIEMSLTWNPLQVIRNRKIRKKVNNVPANSLPVHSLPSTVFSTTGKKSIWEVSTDELLLNLRWSQRNWDLIKDSDGRLIFEDYINESKKSDSIFYKNSQNNGSSFLNPFNNNNRNSINNKKNHSNSSVEHLPSNHFPLTVPFITSRNHNRTSSSSGSNSNPTSNSKNGSDPSMISEQQIPNINIIAEDFPAKVNNSMGSNEIEEMYEKDGSRLEVVSHRFRRLSQSNKNYVKNKFKLRKDHSSSSFNSSNNRSYNSSENNNLDTDKPPKDWENCSTQQLLKLNNNNAILDDDDYELGKTNGTNILSNVSIEPINHRYSIKEDEVGEDGYLSIKPTTKRKPNTSELIKEPSITKSSSNKSVIIPECFENSLNNQLILINCKLQLLESHSIIQNHHYTNTLKMNNCSTKSNELAKSVDQVTTTFEWISNLLPIYLKFLTKEIEHLSNMKSRITSQNSVKMDQLLSSSDRLISRINTSMSISFKNINEKLSQRSTKYSNHKTNDLSSYGQQLVFTLLEYGIIFFLYCLWAVVSCLKLGYTVIFWVLKVLKWALW